MKLLVTTGVIGAATLAAAHNPATIAGKCNVFLPGWKSNCQLVVSPEDVTTCGSKRFPCITKGGLCGQCFQVVYRREEIPSSACAGGICPAYERTVYLKSGEASLDFTQTAMSQAAWGKICPYACKTSEICVEKEADCDTGVYEPKQVIDMLGELRDYPGSCDVREVPISVTVMECEESSEVPAEEDRPHNGAPPQIDPVHNTRSSQCSIFQVPHTSSCGKLITPVKLPGANPPCGDRVENACYAIGPNSDCGKCFSATYTQGVEKGGYTGQAYIKIVDNSRMDQVDMGISQGAWSRLCPHICQGSEQCVAEKSDCENPVPDTDMNGFIFPGSCAVSSIDIMYEEVEC